MPEITLQAVRAKQTELNAMIAALMAQPVATIAVDAIDIDLRDGEHYAGAVLNEDGTVKHHLVLLADKPAESLNWQAAKDWAASVGGELPDRQEAALIFANCKPHVEAAWHWTSETHESNASDAWDCFFSNGHQSGNGKSYAGCARAVRRLNP
jgi:hypothetical protein